MNAKQPENVEGMKPKGQGDGCCLGVVSQNQEKTSGFPTGFRVGLSLKGKSDGTEGECRSRKSGSPAKFVDQAVHVGDGHEFSASGFLGDVTRIFLGSRNGFNARVRAVPVEQRYNTKPVVPVTKRSVTSGIRGMGGQLRFVGCRPGKSKRHLYVRSKMRAGVSRAKFPNGCLMWGFAVR